MSEHMQYWLKILGALALIKMASTLVRDAEKLITANMKSRNPELAADLDVPEVGLQSDGYAEWPDPLDEPQRVQEEADEPAEN